MNAVGDNERGLKKIRVAVLFKSKLPIDFDPSTTVISSFELLGDVLMDLGEYNQTIEAYNKQL